MVKLGGTSVAFYGLRNQGKTCSGNQGFPPNIDNFGTKVETTIFTDYLNIFLYHLPFFSFLILSLNAGGRSDCVLWQARSQGKGTRSSGETRPQGPLQY